MIENPPNAEIIKNLGVTLDRHVQVEVESRKAERDRLVWYVGIAGYVLVNAQALWTVLSGQELLANDLLWLSAPWTAAALLGLLAHLATDEWFDRENLHYYAMRGEIDRLQAMPTNQVTGVEVVDILDSRKPHLDAAKASARRWGSWAKWFRRATFITLCAAFVWSLLGPMALAEIQRASAASDTNEQAEGTTGPLIVGVSGKTISLDAADWKPMQNEFEWAVNLEHMARHKRHEFSRVITVFKLPMSVDRRRGTQVTENEYVEIFTGLPNTVTVQVRVDKGAYWVLSRETFRVPPAPAADFYDPTLAGIVADGVVAGEEAALSRLALQSEIDATRYLLQASF